MIRIFVNFEILFVTLKGSFLKKKMAHRNIVAIHPLLVVPKCIRPKILSAGCSFSPKENEDASSWSGCSFSQRKKENKVPSLRLHTDARDTWTFFLVCWTIIHSANKKVNLLLTQCIWILLLIMLNKMRIIRSNLLPLPLATHEKNGPIVDNAGVAQVLPLALAQGGNLTPPEVRLYYSTFWTKHT